MMSSWFEKCTRLFLGRFDQGIDECLRCQGASVDPLHSVHDGAVDHRVEHRARLVDEQDDLPAGVPALARGEWARGQGMWR